VNNLAEMKERLLVENRGLRQGSARCCGGPGHYSHPNNTSFPLSSPMERFQRAAKQDPNFAAAFPNPNFLKPEGPLVLHQEQQLELITASQLRPSGRRQRPPPSPLRKRALPMLVPGTTDSKPEILSPHEAEGMP